MNLLRLLLIVLLSVAPMGEPLANAQSRTTTTQKKSTTTTQRKSGTSANKKPATTQKKPATTSAKKPTTTQKKPAASAKKPTTTAAKKKPSATTQTKQTTPKKPLTRAEYEQQQKELMQQIAATERMISDNDKSVLSQNRDIKLREEEIRKRQALLESMQAEVEAIRLEEDSLRRVIARLKTEYQGKQEKYAAAVRHLYKWRSGYDEWLFVLSANDVVESMRRIRYLRQYSRWREQEAHLLAKQRRATESVQEKLTLVRQQRESVVANAQKERDKLARKQQQQESAVKKLKSRQRELKAALARDQKRQKEIQNKITKMIAEERRKAEAAQNGKSGTSAKNSKTPLYTPAEVAQLTGSFRQNKGKMPYPVDSNFAILSHYTKDGNYSITLSSDVGAHACAIFEGTVQRVAKSSEDWTVIVSHGDYMSVYSNLSASHVSEGQKVKMRQSIGKIKEDIDGHRTELMFWIFGKTEAENPELWLRK